MNIQNYLRQLPEIKKIILRLLPKKKLIFKKTVFELNFSTKKA